MVFFKDVISSGKTYLVVLDDEAQHIDKGTHLRVHKPLIGNFADKQPKLVNHLYQSGWSRQLEVPKTPTVWTLQSTHHVLGDEVNALPTLKNRITTENIKWRDDIDFIGEYRFLEGYWEWTENILSRFETDLRRVGIYDVVFASLFTYDRNTEVIKSFCEAWCPKTNTLVTSLGEMSISLWDLHSLSGLPMMGRLYDAVVPSSKELLGVDGTNRLHMPGSCKYLFHAYHYLQSQSSPVTLGDWVKFWSRSKMRYAKPPPRKEKKSVRPKSTHNPTGHIKAHEMRTVDDKIPFVRLNIAEKNWNQTFLAAYLSCWLCSFVLPEGDGDLIRPDTFKMASMLASDKKVSLAIPVLASIYRGLNDISVSEDPIQVPTTLPFHFIYSWMAHYFKTHFPSPLRSCFPRMVHYSGEGRAVYYDSFDARKRLHKWDQMNWNCMMLSETENVWYVDDGNAVESHQYFFMAIRSNFLAKRDGDQFVLEPYSPHRFSRQFGYYQVIPGSLQRDIRKASLNDGLVYWRICLSGTPLSKACFPCWTLSSKKLVATSYKNWWETVYRSIFDETVSTLPVSNTIAEVPKQVEKINPVVEKRKLSLQLIDESDSVGSTGEHHWKRQKNREKHVEDGAESVHHFATPNITAMEETFEVHDSGNNHISSQPKQSLPHGKSTKAQHAPRIEDVSKFDCKSIYDNYRNTFLKGFWSELKKKIMRTSVDSMSSIQEDILADVSSMRHHALDYDLSSLESRVKTLFAHATSYDEARSASAEICEKRLEEVESRIVDVKAKKKEEFKQIKSMKQQLVDLEDQHKRLSATLEEHRASQRAIKTQIKELEEELAKLKETPGEEAAEKMVTLRSLLESAKGALEDEDPFV